MPPPAALGKYIWILWSSAETGFSTKGLWNTCESIITASSCSSHTLPSFRKSISLIVNNSLIVNKQKHQHINHKQLTGCPILISVQYHILWYWHSSLFQFFINNTSNKTTTICLSYMLVCFTKMEPVELKVCMYEINYIYIARVNKSEVNPPVLYLPDFYIHEVTNHNNNFSKPYFSSQLWSNPTRILAPGMICQHSWCLIIYTMVLDTFSNTYQWFFHLCYYWLHRLSGFPTTSAIWFHCTCKVF